MSALDKIVVRRPVPPPTVLNPDEEKPLAEAKTKTSEDFHGGSELTFSILVQVMRLARRKRMESEETDEDSHSGGETEFAITPTSLKRLQAEFYRIVEMIAEEKTKHFDSSLGGVAEYNVKKLIMRRYEGKPATSYKMYRARESVLLVLDNSGSMKIWADVLAALADLAAKRRDVEVYLAPNGKIKEQTSPAKRPIDHDSFMSKTTGRVIIYVGDFDGGDTPVELSWRNTVYWIALEDRHWLFETHDWMHYEEKDFKGIFIRTFDIEEIFKAFKKAVSGVRWIDACNYEDCEYEEV